MIASSYPLLNVFWSIFVFFIFFLWIFLLITILIDLFSSHDLGGWAKAFWILGIIILPFLGVLVYVIARGGKMQQHRLQAMKRSQDAFDTEVRSAAGSNVADQLHKLSELKDKGVLTDAEFDAQKAKLLST